jgi:hypothetical protein
LFHVERQGIAKLRIVPRGTRAHNFAARRVNDLQKFPQMNQKISSDLGSFPPIRFSERILA